ncbi:MAG TPA: PAS domain S-box protein [Ignavibacteriaceae bacterium]|nr:PAS domain S-box protein [Ignavibacteriaceae bacterium]
MGTETRILIFSTNPKIVEIFQNFLATKDNQIQISSSAADLEVLIKDYSPDVIIIDSDSKLCSKLKSIIENDSIFILTAQENNPIDFNEIEKSTADYYLEFPFSKNLLLANINFLLNGRKQKRQLKQINNVVNESEQKYKRLFQLSPDGIGYHVGGKIGFINNAGLKILGADSFEEVFGKYFFDFVHPFDKEFVFEKTKNLPKDKPLYLETRIVTLNSQTKYVDIVSTPFLLGGTNAVQFIFRDITEKKLNELNLNENRLRLEFVQKIAKLGYWEFDFKNEKLIWSKDIYEMFGVSENNFQPTLQDFIQIIHSDDRNTFQQSLQASLSGISNLNIEHRIIKTNGQIIFVNQRGAVSYDEKGSIIKFSGSIQDITERKLLENALRENQSRLSGIINSAMDAVVTVDESKNILLFNNAAEKIFHCSADEVIGKSLDRFIRSLDRFIPVRLKDLDQKHIENFSKTGLTMKSMGAINHISGLRADGEEFPIEASISQVVVGGQKLFTVIIRDVTEKKKAEEDLISSEVRYRLLFKKNPLPMWVFDIETYKFLAVNFAAVKVYGYTVDEFLSMTIFDIRPAEEVTRLRNYVSKPRKPFQSAGLWCHKKKDGTLMDVEVISHEIEFDGRPARLVLSIDVTDKKKAEDELKNSREQLRELAGHLQNIREEERSAIAREIHDELGQVLTSLKMNLTFIDKKITSEEELNAPALHNEISEMKSVIDNSVKRIRKIITELRPEMLDQLGLISALEWQANEFKAKSGIECSLENYFGETTVNKNISIAVYRIFQEALTNVIRHSKATKVDIKIGRANNHLELEICDNGIGFDQKKNKSKTFGVLGMRERAIILGGDFNVENIKPSGTRISVNIPLEII